MKALHHNVWLTVHRKRILVALSAIALAVVISSGSTVSRTMIAPPQIPGAEFIGSKSCAECHAAVIKDFKTATHALLKAEGDNAKDIGFGRDPFSQCVLRVPPALRNGPLCPQRPTVAYSENIGHKDWPGCFHWHDVTHRVATDANRKTPARDCTSCHTILAQGAGADLGKLIPKGLAFIHVGAEYENFDCARCHTGVPKVI